MLRDLSKDTIIEKLNEISPDYIVNLAAHIGVRHSLKFPHDYTRSNIDSFLNILEYAKSPIHCNILCMLLLVQFTEQIQTYSFQESHGVDHPLQYYAVTKRANELMAHSYSNLYNIRTTGLRFFYCLRAMGKARYGLVLIYRRHFEGRTNKSF